MRLARVLATDRAKLTASAAPRGDLATDQISGDYAVTNKGCCSRCSANEESVPASKEEHWSCGVCYDEICCPFSLPCGHTVCGDCLQQLLRRQARCPFCRVSVFRGCTFGRNVAMWNAIQARHPVEAAQLADNCAVITHQPTSPVRPALTGQDHNRPSQHFTANTGHFLQQSGQAMPDAQIPLRDRQAATSAFPGNSVRDRSQSEDRRQWAQTAEPATPISSGPTTSSMASRVGLGLLAPLRPETNAHESHSASASTAEPDSVAEYAPESLPESLSASVTGTRSLHQSPTRALTTGVPPVSPSQTAVLRRAQAAFADLRGDAATIIRSASDSLRDWRAELAYRTAELILTSPAVL